MTRPGQNWLWSARKLSRPPLPTSAVEYFMSDFSCSPTSWVGQLMGHVLTAQNSPPIAADGAFFNGRPVAQCEYTAARAFLSAADAPTPFVTTGQKPWILTIARFRTLKSGKNILFLLANTGVTLSGPTAAITTTTNNNYRSEYYNATSPIDSGVAPGTAVHKFLDYYNTSGARICQVDSTASAPVGSGGSHLDISNIRFARDSFAGGEASVSIAFHLICNAEPTTPEKNALNAWTLLTYGI